MSLSKRKGLVAPPGVAKETSKLEQQPETGRTIGDLPPEVLTIILEHLTLDEGRNKMLGYRLVDPRWKNIVDSLLEKKLVTGKIEIFPAMKIGGQRPEFLHLRCSPAMFRAGGNPFPTKSLILTGNSKRSLNYLPEDPADARMPLPVFILTFGGNLTTFGLENRVMDLNTLVGILGFMPNLKVVSFKNVKLPNEMAMPDVLPTPPPLPNLKIIEAKSTGAKDETGNILYVWLIASFADQLVSLTVGTKDVFPPLQQRHNYLHPLSRKVSIATTSDAAFGKLKELTLFRPTGDFLNQSGVPALKHLSVAGLAKQHYVNLENVIQFIVKCGENLERLTLDVIWDELLGGELRPYIPRPPAVETTSVKMVTLRFPDKDLYSIFRFNLLNLFPGLEILQLLRFSSNELPVKVEAARLDNESKRVEEVVALKAQLTSNRQEVSAKKQPLYHQMAAFNHGGFDFDIDNPRFVELNKELRNVETTDRRVRAPILKRLAALGENVGEVLIREMLDQIIVWNDCPSLKMVSVSSGSEPDGDVCLIPRPNGNDA